MMIGTIDLVFGSVEHDMLQSLDHYCLPAGVYFCNSDVEIFTTLRLKEKMAR